MTCRRLDRLEPTEMDFIAFISAITANPGDMHSAICPVEVPGILNKNMSIKLSFSNPGY